MALLVVTHRLHSSSFLGFVNRILYGNPQKELLWSLWVWKDVIGFDNYLYYFGGSLLQFNVPQHPILSINASIL